MPRRRKRAVILDFDGVIADSFRIDFVIQMVADLGYTVHEDSRHLLFQHWGMTTVKLLMTCFRLDEEDAARVNAEWERRDRENEGAVGHIEGVVEAVKELANAGYALAIVSSRERWSLKLLLQQWDIFFCFVVLTAHEDTTDHKPHPGAFKRSLEAFRKLNIGKEEVVFIGDTIVDKQAGEAAGIDTLLVETGPYPHVHRHSHPHDEERIIPSAAHLPIWMERHLQQVIAEEEAALSSA